MLSRGSFFSVFFAPLQLCAFALSIFSFLHAAQEDVLAQRVHAHLVIEDCDSACAEAKAALQEYPNSKILWEAYIHALGHAKNEKAMLSAWKQYVSLFPDEQNNRMLIEEMAWSIIEKGTQSSSPNIRIMSMLGGYFAQDARGVAILHKNLNDRNSFVRGVAVQLAGTMNDAKLRDEMLPLFRQETVWSVRMEAMKALGNMKIAAAKEDLIAILASNKSTVEEQAIAIQSLVMMKDDVHREEVLRLASSPRSGLRLLGCELIAHFRSVRDLDQAIFLLRDHNADVRAASLHAIGLLRATEYNGKPIIDIVLPLLNDSDATVVITAAWLITLHDATRGQKAFESLFNLPEQEERLKAASALAATGRYGFPLTLNILLHSQDHYVRANLAFALITQRIHPDLGCDALYAALVGEKERWMWDDSGLGRTLAPSKIKHKDGIPNYPEAINQTTRLEVLNVLAIMKYEHAQAAIKKFLQERNWGITGLASALLLTEGDETAIDLIHSMLADPEKKVRIQAALILSLWGRDETAIAILQEAYASADRDLKERILEGLGRIGAASSIPFLTDRLGDQHQSLRIIAACSLIMCLNH